jgi:hypothetical protein
MACLIRRVRVGVALRNGAAPSLRLGIAVRSMPFVGGEQRDAGLLQLVLDLGAEVGDAGDPLDRFADHGDEPAVGPLGLGQEIGDAAVASDGDVKLFVGRAHAAVLHRGAAGLDVVELGHDDEAVGQCLAGGLQLAGQGQGGVLRVVGGCPPEPRDWYRRALEQFGDVLVGNHAQPVQQADLIAVVVGQCGHIW